MVYHEPETGVFHHSIVREINIHEAAVKYNLKSLQTLASERFMEAIQQEDATPAVL